MDNLEIYENLYNQMALAESKAKRELLHSVKNILTVYLITFNNVIVEEFRPWFIKKSVN